MAEDSDNALLPRIGGGGGIPAPVLVNPLAAQNAGIQSAKGLWDIRGQQAQESIGQAYLDSIDPKTGRLDPLTFQQKVKAGGAINAMGAKDAAVTGEQLQTSQQKLSEAQQGQVHTAISAALLEKDDSRLSAAVLQQAQRLIDGGVPRDRVMSSLLNLSSNPAEMRRQLEVTLTGLMPPAQREGFIYGPQTQQTGPGGRTIGVVRDPRTGAVSTPQQQGAPLGLSPESVAAHQQWLKTERKYPDPANPNVIKDGTNETYLKDSGVPDQYIYIGGAPATPGTQPGAASPLGTGRPPAPLLNPNKPQTAPAPATPSPAPATPSPAGTGISGPTPEQKAAAAATAKQGELGPPEFQRHATEDTQAQNQQAVLGNMLVDTSQFTSGPLAGIVGKVRNLAGNLGLNINTEAQSAKESFNKLAAGLANAQGAGSDARMNVNISANPHEELSPAGVDLILRQLQGNTDYIRARASLAAKHTDKANYPAFQESIKELDPRVFQLSRMTQPQRDTYWKSLDDTVKTQLGGAIRKAKEMGVLGG